MQFTVLGVIPSKSNSYKIGRGHFYRDPKVAQYEEDFAWQTGQVPKHTFDPKANLFVRYGLYLKNMNQDADNCEKTINDILQKLEIIFNDKKIIVHHTIKSSDKINPRAVIAIEELK